MSSDDGAVARFGFEARIIEWRGPSPFFYAPIPADQAAEIRRLARAVTYGWGMIPVEASIGETVFRTALFPKDETYLLPLKSAVRRAIGVTAGDPVGVDMTVRPAPPSERV